MAIEGGASRAFSSFQIRLSAAMLRQAAGWGYLPAGRRHPQRHSRPDGDGHPQAARGRRRLHAVERRVLSRLADLPAADGVRQHDGHQAVRARADVVRVWCTPRFSRRPASRRARSTWSRNAPGGAAAIADVFFESPAVRCHQFHGLGQDRAHPRRASRPGPQAHGARTRRVQPGDHPRRRGRRGVDQGGDVRRVPAPGPGLHEHAQGLRRPLAARRVRCRPGRPRRVAQDRRSDRSRRSSSVRSSTTAPSSRSRRESRMRSIAARPSSPAERPMAGSMRPTILTHVPADAICTTGADETFGPLLVIEAFDDVEAALREAQDTPYGLSASIMTRRSGPRTRTGRAIRHRHHPRQRADDGERSRAARRGSQEQRLGSVRLLLDRGLHRASV